MTPSVLTAYKALSQRRGTWQGEEEVRIGWVKAMEIVLNIQIDAERVKKDASYNNVIVEFKAPGLFKGSHTSAGFKNAINDRLRKYIRDASKRDQIPEADYQGIAIDGDHIAFAKVDMNGNLIHQPLMPFDITAFSMVMEAFRSGFRRAITAANLKEDFGHSSILGIPLMQAFSDALANALSRGSHNKKIEMLFEEWETLYGQAANLSAQQSTSIDDSLSFKFQGPAAKNLPAKLFVTHTFHSLLIKIIAAEIVAAHGMASSKSLVYELIAEKSDQGLCDRLNYDIERGGFFNAVGLHGFVEEAIFSWYFDAASGNKADRTAICAALREILGKMAVYRFDSLQNSGKSRDVIRDFYQDLVPEELRKSLGEFYTPDWLVEHTMDKASYSDDEWLKIRVLDPTCGSGSFLLEAIERKRKVAARNGLSPEETIQLITSSVYGFDLNPLAVQSARVNFLMAIADLLGKCKGIDLEIPILLADAIYSPAPDPDGDEKVVKYVIGSRRANLEILLPAELVRDRQALDEVFRIMGEDVDADNEYSVAESHMLKAGVLTSRSASEWRHWLKATYDQVLELHRQNWNGIWFRVVRNFFWSATAGQFDLIAGNPPWVRWSNLPEAYRNRAKPTCLKYDIFSDKKFYGGNELDISAMITYTAADKWLKEDGKLAFVITQTVFQSPSSQGFRSFRLNKQDMIIPLSVDDLKELKPFPDAANKTAVVLFQKRKNAKIVYPIPYCVWRGLPKLDKAGQPKVSKSGRPTLSKSIDASLTKPEVYSLINRLPWEANPVSNHKGAPWAVLPPGRFGLIQTLCGSSTWVNGRKGITTDLNGIFFVAISDINIDRRKVEVTTRPGKTNIGGARIFWVEPDMLYPLAKGASDFEACYFSPKERLFTFVPNKGILKADLDQGAVEMSSPALKSTRAYFNAYKKQLENRSTYKSRMRDAPFYSIYNVGAYTFSPFKVIWPEMSSSFCSAVVTAADVPFVGKRPYVPDHKIFFVDFDQEEPAYFLCGLLNSTVIKELIESHNISTSMGDVFKHIDLSPFDSKDKQHKELFSLVKNAHFEPEEGKRRLIVEMVISLADKIIANTISVRSNKNAA